MAISPRPKNDVVADLRRLADAAFIRTDPAFQLLRILHALNHAPEYGQVAVEIALGIEHDVKLRAACIGIRVTCHGERARAVQQPFFFQTLTAADREAVNMTDNRSEQIGIAQGDKFRI